jgi:hypothetical protein
MSCLFDSLSVSVDKSSNDLRQEIVQFMIDNKNKKIEGMAFSKWIEESEDVDFDNYVKCMTDPQQWAGYMELLAFCYIYDRCVIVQYGNKELEIGDPDDPKIKIKYNGTHYWVGK